MPSTFSHITFAQAKAALAALLNDPGTSTSFYSDAELGVYIVEALRFWGSATGYWRDRTNFTTSTATGTPPTVTPTADNPWYDLPTWIAPMRGYNVFDSAVLQSIEYHLLEPPTVPYSGSSQFTQAAIISAMQRRRDQFLLETNIVLSHIQMNPPAPPIDRVPISDRVISIDRAAWYHTATRQWRKLSRSDEWSMLGYYQPAWTLQSPDTPKVYSVAVTPPLVMQLAPPPNDVGLLDLIVVLSGIPLAPVSPSAGVLMGVPDDLVWVVKFGALADLLNADGPAKDPQRAEYCQQRWSQGIELARIAQSVLFLSINNVPMYVESLSSVDSGRPLWQNYSGNPPFMGALAGLNLLAMVDPPGGAASITLDVVTNALIPTADGDFIQVGREEMSVILGYAEHLATFKCGGAEFEQTMPNLSRIMDLAMRYNTKLAAVTQPSLTDRAQRERVQRGVLV